LEIIDKFPFIILCFNFLSDAAYGGLLTKFSTMGYAKDHLDETLKYIRDTAPIIIHFNCTNGFLINRIKIYSCFLVIEIVIKFFADDTHYRNQFETNTSGGCLSHSARTDWERRLFNSIYDSCAGFDRVKYGVLNIVSGSYYFYNSFLKITISFQKK